eukprot:2474661-Pleurochrysis_carterae.AAC.1
MSPLPHPANRHRDIPEASFVLAEALRRRHVHVDGPHELSGEVHATAKSPFVSRSCRAATPPSFTKACKASMASNLRE